MRMRDDFGPCELTERVRAALGRWCCPGGQADGRRLVVALGVMANTGSSNPEPMRAIARRAGVDHKTASAWASEWQRIEAQVREHGADAELMRALVDVGQRLGRQAQHRAADEMAEAQPSAGHEHRPVVRLWPRAADAYLDRSALPPAECPCAADADDKQAG